MLQQTKRLNLRRRGGHKFRPTTLPRDKSFVHGYVMCFLPVPVRASTQILHTFLLLHGRLIQLFFVVVVLLFAFVYYGINTSSSI